MAQIDKYIDLDPKAVAHARGRIYPPVRIRAAAGLLLIFCLVLLQACAGEKEYLFSGRTMGTTYHIKVVGGKSVDVKGIQTRVDQRLEQINQSMSTFRPDSEISRFNAFDQVNTPFPISADFLRVMLAAREVYRLTGGAWDGTVNPLVNLWGFGKAGAVHQVPSAEALKEARRNVGFDQIEISVSGSLIKKNPAVTVDLASIAKGYGVDQIALLIHGLGFKHYLVEIGGEVYASGSRPDGKPWRVGINYPSADALRDRGLQSGAAQ